MSLAIIDILDLHKSCVETDTHNLLLWQVHHFVITKSLQDLVLSSTFNLDDIGITDFCEVKFVFLRCRFL